jgi:hypothetical protein
MASVLKSEKDLWGDFVKEPVSDLLVFMPWEGMCISSPIHIKFLLNEYGGYLDIKIWTPWSVTSRT